MRTESQLIELMGRSRVRHWRNQAGHLYEQLERSGLPICVLGLREKYVQDYMNICYDMHLRLRELLAQQRMIMEQE